jgi:ABC-2 type transport system permease protein
VGYINQQSSEEMYAFMEGVITQNQSILVMMPQENPPDSGVDDDTWALLISGNLPQLWEPYGVSTDDVLGSMEYMAKPLEVGINSFTAGDRFNYISWLFPGMILVLVLWNGLMFTTLTVVENKENGMLKRIFSTPTGSGAVLGGMTLNIIVKIAIDLLILTAIAFIFYVIILPGDWLLAFPLFILCILSMIGIGLILGALINDSKAAEGACMGLAMSLQFLTGLFIPLWQLPQILQDIMGVIPLTQGQYAIRQVLYYGGDWESVAPTVGILILQTAVLFGMGILLYTWMVRKHRM